MKLRELRHNLWNVGFIEEGLEHTLSCRKPIIHWAKKRINDRWFADPFILDVTDSEIIILAEEYCYKVRRGRLARVVFDRKTYEEKSFEIILDLPTHLSFPFIFRKNGKMYIMPENSASGCSTIYEYDDFSRKMTPITHVSEEPFTDATLFELNGESYLWTTMTPDPNGKSLSVYKFNKESFLVEDLITKETFPINTARNAGEVFSLDGILYRPAQDCTACYGNGVVLQRVVCEEGKWNFVDVNSFYPDTFKYNQGIHTFNHYKGLIVVDARGYRNPVIGRILTFLFKILGKR